MFPYPGTRGSVYCSVRLHLQWGNLKPALFQIPSTIFLLRFLSALFSTLSLFLIYFLGKKAWSQKAGFLALVLLALSPGAIQAAHFGTFESGLTFLYLLVFWFILGFLQKKNLKNYYLSLVILAIATAIKASSLVLLPLPILVLLPQPKKKFRLKQKLFIIASGLVVFLTLTVLFSPYYLTADFTTHP